MKEPHERPSSRDLRRPLAETSDGIAETEERRVVEAEDDPGIFCRFCGSEITSAGLAMAVEGSHAHQFRNPLGLTFRIGCFAGAPGCITQGLYTMDFTWFPGFSWCIALCAQCRIHLGWHYEGKGRAFYGLIRDHLVQDARIH